MNSSSTRKLFICVLGVLAIAILFFTSSTLSSYIHTGVNIFAGGRSNAKVYAFFVYFLVLLSIALLRPKISLIDDERRAKKLLLGSIGFLFALGFAGLIYFIHAHGFTFNDFILTFNNGEISSTSVAHNHIGKGVIGHVLQVFGYTNFETIDAGHAFIGLLPSWFYLIFGIVLAVAIYLTIGIFIKKCQVKHPRLLYIFLYATLSFGVIEHTFDGGFADPRSAILFVLFSLLLLGAARRRVLGVIAVGILSFVLSFVYMKTNALSGEDSYQRLILTLVAYGGFFYVPLILLFKDIPKQLRYLLWFLAVLFIVPFFLNALDTNAYNEVSTKNDPAYVALYPSDKAIPYTITDRFNTLSIYEIPAGTFPTIHGILSKYDLLDNMVPVAVPWQTCFPKGQATEYNFILTSKDKITTGESSTSLSTTLITSIESEQAQWHTYTVKIILKPCTPRHVNILGEIIKGRGAETFFMSSISAESYIPDGK